MADDFQWHSLSVVSEVGCSGEASAWARDLAARAGLPEERVYALDLCIVEIVSNIADHSYRGKKGEIRLDLALGPTSAVLTFIDRGPEFDPLSAPPPRVATSLDDMPLGGLGLQMVRATTDACRYQRRDGLNLFTVYIGTK
jgi:anti-sigma regulatory factor (Ser/Thr protein kinase)